MDVLVGAVVELTPVALLEQLREAGHLAQRLLEVVGGDVGELLELGVGAGEIGRPLVELDLRRLADGELARRCGCASPPPPIPTSCSSTTPPTRTGWSKFPAATLVASDRSSSSGRLDPPAHESEEPGDEHTSTTATTMSMTTRSWVARSRSVRARLRSTASGVLQRLDGAPELVEAGLAGRQRGGILRCRRAGGDVGAGRLGVRRPPALAGRPGGVQLGADGEPTDEAVEGAQRPVPCGRAGSYGWR